MANKKRSHRRALRVEDQTLWEHVTKSVRRVQTDLMSVASQNQTLELNEPIRKTASKPKKTRTFPIQPAPMQFKPSVPSMSHGDTSGMDRRTTQKLKRGKLDIEGTLDLHGYTQTKAHQALSRFLQTGYETGRRTVLIITGKGDRLGGRPGILKEAVPEWLNETPMRQWVAGFSYAAPKDGGNGALYVRIKRRREKS
jgi:DNA-nicking Smr family endonuclease